MSAIPYPTSRVGQFNKDKLILTVLLVGFVISAIEVRFLHRGVVSEETAAWIPTIASIAGAIACGAALFEAGWARMTAMISLLGVMLTGLVGVYFHTEFKPSAFTGLFASQSSPTAIKAESEEEGYAGFEKTAEAEAKAPALAPLSIAGLASIGVLVLMGRRKEAEPQP